MKDYIGENFSDCIFPMGQLVFIDLLSFSGHRTFREHTGAPIMYSESRLLLHIIRQQQISGPLKPSCQKMSNNPFGAMYQADDNSLRYRLGDNGN